MFAPAVAAAILVVLAGVLAVFSARAGAGYLPGLNVRQPALARLTPTRNAPPARASRRVIVVIIDGLRLSDSFGTPYLTSLRRAGIDAAARSHFPTISRANYVSIVTGVPPVASGVRSNTYHWPVDLDSLMARARDAGLASAFVGDYSPGLAFMFPDDFTDLYYTPWPGGFERAATAVIDRDYPLVVLLPGKVDAMGHRFGADSREYRDAVRFVDDQLAHALAGVDLSRDTIIVCADHGHTDSGGHGGTEDEVMEVPLIMAGAGIRAGAAIGPAQLIDIAPTAAALLGISAPGHGLGRPLTEALAASAATRSALDHAGTLRAARNNALLSEIATS
ncbi:MAG TPA: alkaline phosphatase family protein, partial [Kofleriaceae bacterium]|nr:alkaline phosphatase family protein [Kofleriaceae bacterium]